MTTPWRVVVDTEAAVNQPGAGGDNEALRNLRIGLANSIMDRAAISNRPKEFIRISSSDFLG